jgi:hypothetical protein
MSRFLIIFFVIVLSGCHTLNTCDDQWWYNRDPVSKLEKSIKNFEDGDYDSSMAYLNQIVTSDDANRYIKVEAYKYRAFIYCLGNKQSLCQESFKMAFILNPKFELTKAEAGHPIWGPVYKRVKLY